MGCRWVSGLAVVVVALAGATELWAAPLDVTATEYTLYVEWTAAREDAKLGKLNQEAKVKRVAAALGVSAKELQRVIAKVEPEMASIKPEAEKAMRARLDETPLKGRILSVELNTETEHAVALVKWRCGDPRDWDKEAAYLAWAVNAATPVTKILGLWCVNELDAKLFSAKIGRPGIERITKEAVERFATSRYIKLFEEVKRGPHT